MKMLSRILAALLLVILLIIGALFYLVATISPNDYRDAIAKTISEAMGASVSLNGSIALSASWRHGLVIKINDTIIEHPTAHATVRNSELAIAVPPLLERKIIFNYVGIDSADIKLGGGAKDANKTLPIDTQLTEQSTSNSTLHSAPLSLQLSNLSIANTNIYFGGTKIHARAVNAKLGNKTTEIDAEVVVNDIPAVVNIKGDGVAELAAGKQPFNFVIQSLVNKLVIAANGLLSLSEKTLTLNEFSVNANESSIKGKGSANWQGVRPIIRAVISAEQLNVNDIKNAIVADSVMAESNEPARENSSNNDKDEARPRIFSKEPLALDAMRSFDAAVDLEINGLKTDSIDLDSLQTRIDLKDGHLLLSPITLLKGGNKIKAQAKIDNDKAPLRVVLRVQSNDAALEKFLKQGILQSLLSGKASFDLDLLSYGMSPYELASNLSGTANVTAVGGSLSPVSGWLTTGLLESFIPGIGDLAKPGLNCMAARISATNGVLKTKGWVMDMGAATMAGAGTVDLRTENIDMNLLARPKIAKGGALAKLSSPLQIKGNITSPQIKAAPLSSITGAAAQIIENLSGKNGSQLGGIIGDVGKAFGLQGALPQVPVVEQRDDGSNACLEAIDSPQSGQSKGNKADVMTQPTMGDITNTAKGIIESMGSKLPAGLGEIFK